MVSFILLYLLVFSIYLVVGRYVVRWMMKNSLCEIISSDENAGSLAIVVLYWPIILFAELLSRGLLCLGNWVKK